MTKPCRWRWPPGQEAPLAAGMKSRLSQMGAVPALCSWLWCLPCAGAQSTSAQGPAPGTVWYGLGQGPSWCQCPQGHPCSSQACTQHRGGSWVIPLCCWGATAAACSRSGTALPCSSQGWVGGASTAHTVTRCHHLPALALRSLCVWESCWWHSCLKFQL